jgi:hypothetical protein
VGSGACAGVGVGGEFDRVGWARSLPCVICCVS